jgi:hypothetical protein
MPSPEVILAWTFRKTNTTSFLSTLAFSNSRHTVYAGAGLKD